jgi:hypothetical protein
MKAIDFIGISYPVRDLNENIVGSKIITSAYEMENLAGISISLDNSHTLIFVGYMKALELLEKKEGK